MASIKHKSLIIVIITVGALALLAVASFFIFRSQESSYEVYYEESSVSLYFPETDSDYYLDNYDFEPESSSSDIYEEIDAPYDIEIITPEAETEPEISYLPENGSSLMQDLFIQRHPDIYEMTELVGDFATVDIIQEDDTLIFSAQFTQYLSRLSMGILLSLIESEFDSIEYELQETLEYMKKAGIDSPTIIVEFYDINDRHILQRVFD